MKNNKYSTLFSGLDVAPADAASSDSCTKGTGSNDGTEAACSTGFSRVDSGEE